MPKKQKFTKEEIIMTALSIVKSEGMDGVTARGLGAALGTSSRPIFTAFKDMKEVRAETLNAAKKIYNDYARKAFESELPFRELGMEYFRFARDEAKLFELLFMRDWDKKMGLSDFLHEIIVDYERILQSIQECYNVSYDFACHSFESMWVFTHGVSCLQATSTIQFTEEKVRALIDETFTGLYLVHKEQETT